MVSEKRDTIKISIMTFIPFIFLSLFSIIISGYIHIDKYPASLTYNIFLFRDTDNLFCRFWIHEVRKLGKVIFYPLRIFGMYPLTIFVFHYILLQELIKLFPIYLSLDFIEFSGLFAGVFIIFTGLGFFWEKWKFIYSLDWVLKFISHKVLKNKKIILNE